jgi:hypothetical protein
LGGEAVRKPPAGPRGSAHGTFGLPKVYEWVTSFEKGRVPASFVNRNYARTIVISVAIIAQRNRKINTNILAKERGKYGKQN